MMRVPRSFVQEVLWPEFEALNQALQTYLNDVTLRVIRAALHEDAEEATELAQALPAPR